MASSYDGSPIHMPYMLYKTSFHSQSRANKVIIIKRPPWMNIELICSWFYFAHLCFSSFFHFSSRRQRKKPFIRAIGIEYCVCLVKDTKVFTMNTHKCRCRRGTVTQEMLYDFQCGDALAPLSLFIGTNVRHHRHGRLPYGKMVSTVFGKWNIISKTCLYPYITYCNVCTYSINCIKLLCVSTDMVSA